MYYHIKYHGEDFPDIIYWSSHSLEEEITYHSKYHPDAEITVYSTDDIISKKLLTLTNQLFEHLKSQQQEPPYTITTENYGNGYFIFDYGPNTVVHFRLKETPGWLYGIWWELKINTENEVSIVGKFFAQYENEISLNHLLLIMCVIWKLLWRQTEAFVLTKAKLFQSSILSATIHIVLGMETLILMTKFLV